MIATWERLRALLALSSADQGVRVDITSAEVARQRLLRRVRLASLVTGFLVAAAFVVAKWDFENAFFMNALVVLMGIASIPMAVTRATLRAPPASAKPGEVRIGWTRIRAGDVTGLSAATCGDRVSIAVARGAAARSMLLDVAAADAATVLESLGSGERGAGDVIAIPLRSRTISVFGAFCSTVAAVALGVLLHALYVGSSAAPTVAATAFVIMAAVAVILELWTHRVRGAIELRRDAVVFPGLSPIQYAEIRYVRPVARRIEIETYAGVIASAETVEGYATTLDASQSDAVAHHILAGAERAQGPGTGRVVVSPILVRGTTRANEWLASLDDAAARMGSAHGYRERALHPDDLMRVLRDVDLPLGVRAAAARVLIRSGAERATIERIVAAFHGDEATTYARVIAGLEERSPARLEEAAEALVEEQAELEQGRAGRQ